MGSEFLFFCQCPVETCGSDARWHRIKSAGFKILKMLAAKGNGSKVRFVEFLSIPGMVESGKKRCWDVGFFRKKIGFSPSSPRLNPAWFYTALWQKKVFIGGHGQVYAYMHDQVRAINTIK